MVKLLNFFCKVNYRHSFIHFVRKTTTVCRRAMLISYNIHWFIG